MKPVEAKSEPKVSRTRIKLMQDLEFCRVYLDDLLCITRGPFEEHLGKIQLVFELLTKGAFIFKFALVRRSKTS